MERAQYNRHSRAQMAETAKDVSRHATPCNAGRAGARPDRARRCEKCVEMCHYTGASSPESSLYARVAAPIQDYPFSSCQ